MHGLVISGEPCPLEPEVLECAPPLPAPIAQLLRTWGVGRLCGRFELRAPGDSLSARWQSILRARSAREQGWFASIGVDRLSSFFVLAVDEDGHALACGPRPHVLAEPSFWFFAANGRVVWVGDDFERHLIAAFLAGPGFERVTGHRRIHLASYHVGPTAGVDDLLRRLEQGDEDGADALLPAVLAGGDAADVERAILTALLGSRGDVVQEPLRRSYARQVAKMLFRVDEQASRGAPSLGIGGERVFPTHAERAWAATLLPPRREMEGPFAPGVDAGVPFEPAATAYVTALGAPRIDGPARTRAAMRAWVEHDPSFDLSAVLAASATLDGVAQQSLYAALAEMWHPRRRMLRCPGDGSIGYPEDDEVAARARAARAFVDRAPDAAWALFVLALRDPELAHPAWSLLCVRELGRPMLVKAGLSLLIRPPPLTENVVRSPESRRGDLPCCGLDLAQHTFPDDALVERLVPLLSSADRWQRHQVAHLLAARIDVDAVFDAFVADVERLDAPVPQRPRPPEVAKLWHARADDPELGALADLLFLECGASTRALAKRPEKRARDALRNAARRGDLNLRLNASCALAKIGDPEGRALLIAALRAYD